MEISHVIRGEEWLPSSPLHVLLYRYLGWSDKMPQFAHLPLLLKPDGNGKLSKRDGDRLGFPVFPLDWKDEKTGTISSGYREAGYFPEALVNFLALLGWNPGTEQEIFTMDELIDLFSLERVSKSGAKFDYEKGKWFNHQYVQLKSVEEIADLFYPVLVEHNISADKQKVKKVVQMVRERVNFVHELWEQAFFFFVAPTEYAEAAVKKRWKTQSAEQMQELVSLLETINDFSSENTEEIVKAWIASKEYGMGAVMNAFRICLVGDSKGPHLFDITGIIGKEETIKRLKRAVEVLR
jgi:glutamyl-tRNA synthetase